MKKLIIVLVSALFLLMGCSRQFCRECNVSGLIAFKHQSIPIFKEPGRKVFDYIIEDTIKENYHLLLIKKIQSNYAYVTIEKDNGSGYIRGWIPLDVVAIRPAVYSGDMNLYEVPDPNSNIQSIVCNPEWIYYHVKKCYNKWLYVELEYQGKFYSGWMRPEDQCSNPYSTCN